MGTVATSLPDRPQQAIPSLTRSFVWTLGGNVLYSLCQWGMLSVLAKLGTPHTVGMFALGLAVSAPVFMFTNLQLRTVQATDTGEISHFGNFFTLRCACSLLALAFILVVCLGIGYMGQTLAVIMSISLAKAIESIEDVVAGLLQKHERLDLAARAISLRGFLSLCIFAIIFARVHRVDIACASLVLSWGAVVLLYDLSLARRFLSSGERFWSRNFTSIWRLIRASLPLGIVMMLISLNANIPRYILERYLGAGQLGIFASLAYVLVAVNLLVLALGQAASARLARMFASGYLSEFRRILWKLIAFGSLIGVGCVVFAMVAGSKFLLLVYGAAYAANRSLLIWLSCTVGINAVASFLGFAVTAAQYFRQQVPVIACMTATTWGASWLLVPRLGLIGAAIALLISACVQLAGLSIIMRRAFFRRSTIA